MTLTPLSLILFITCSVVGALTTWLAVWLSHRTGILDMPDPRKVHRAPVAYLGGLGVSLTVILGVALYSALAPAATLAQQDLVYAFLGGLVAIFLVGLWDDVVGMRPTVKLGAQMLIALCLWGAGVRIERLNIGLAMPLDLLGDSEAGLALFILSSIPSILVTVGWYVALINAINLIDGLDGLAGGVSFIAALSLGVVGLVVVSGRVDLGLVLPLIAAGACLGFLLHNWHPAKIFLGDSGSMSIGYVLGTAAMISSTKTPALLTLLIPMVALGLPLFETAYSFARRILSGSHPFKADRRHLHHRLLDAGLDQRRVVIIFLFATAYLGVNAVLMAQARQLTLLINVVMLGIGLLMLIEYLTFFERRRRSSGIIAQPQGVTPASGADPR
jgi:UDP-GlcNAc:undecaprenyl-phosphate GlcNAc-1-phosphate transferase